MAIMIIVFIILFSVSVAALSISSSQQRALLKKGCLFTQLFPGIARFSCPLILCMKLNFCRTMLASQRQNFFERFQFGALASRPQTLSKPSSKRSCLSKDLFNTTICIATFCWWKNLNDLRERHLLYFLEDFLLGLLKLFHLQVAIFHEWHFAALDLGFTCN